MEGSGAMSETNAMMASAAVQKLIAERAYQLWENRGKPQGYDLIHWREAEQEIRQALERSTSGGDPDKRAG
jgi:hypothetical protein